MMIKQVLSSGLVLVYLLTLLLGYTQTKHFCGDDLVATFSSTDGISHLDCCTEACNELEKEEFDGCCHNETKVVKQGKVDASVKLLTNVYHQSLAVVKTIFFNCKITYSEIQVLGLNLFKGIDRPPRGSVPLFILFMKLKLGGC